MIKLISIQPTGTEDYNWKMSQIKRETPMGSKIYNKLVINTETDKIFYMTLVSKVDDPTNEITTRTTVTLEDKTIEYALLEDKSINIRKTNDGIMVLKRGLDKILEKDVTFLSYHTSEDERIIGVKDESDNHIVFKKINNNYMILILKGLDIERKSVSESKINIYTVKGDKTLCTSLNTKTKVIKTVEVEEKILRKDMKALMNNTESKAFVIGLEKDEKEIDKFALDNLLKFTNKFSRIPSYKLFKSVDDIIKRDYIPQVTNRFDTYIILYKIGDENIIEHIKKKLASKATNNKIIVIE